MRHDTSVQAITQTREFFPAVAIIKIFQSTESPSWAGRKWGIIVSKPMFFLIQGRSVEKSGIDSKVTHTGNWGK